MLVAFHVGSLRELVLPFVRRELTLNSPQNCTPLNFFQYSNDKGTHDPTSKYLYEQVCRFSQAIVNFHMGVRRGCASLVHSGKYMSKELFHGRSHPLYKEIELYDTVQYMIMPTELQMVYDSNISFTTSGSPSTGQGLDFCLEQQNRQVKSYLPRAEVPSENLWRRTVLNQTRLQQMDCKMKEILGLESGCASSGIGKNIDLDEAIHLCQKLIRENNYLCVAENEQREHVSLSGRRLHPQLVDFVPLATKKRIVKICSDILSQPTADMGPEHKLPVFVTPEECEKMTSVESKTKDVLLYECKERLGKVYDMNRRGYFDAQLKQLKKSTKKDAYVALHVELSSYLATGQEMETEHNSALMSESVFPESSI